MSNHAAGLIKCEAEQESGGLFYLFGKLLDDIDFNRLGVSLLLLLLYSFSSKALKNTRFT